MRAIILAAGRGSRLGQRTADRPKCLTELAGKPLLCWQIEALTAAGIEQIAVVRGYQAQMLEGYGLTHFDNARWQETNMVASLTCAAPWLEAEPCLVSYADIVYHPDIVRALICTEVDLSVAYDRLWRDLWTARFADPLADAETFRLTSDGHIAEIGARAQILSEIEGQYMGLLRFTPEGWRQVRNVLNALTQEQIDRLDMTSLLNRLIGSGTRIKAVPTDGRWCEVDCETDLALYERLLSSDAGWTHRWEWQ